MLCARLGADLFRQRESRRRARYLRSSGDVANLTLVNLGTLVGAVCFFVGAAPLPVESATQVSGEPEPA